MVSLLKIEYSTSVFDTLTIGLSLNGGDIMNINKLVRSIAMGKIYYGGLFDPGDTLDDI